MLHQLQLLWEWVSTTPEDQVVFPCDYVSLGSDSQGVLDFLVQLHASENVQARFLLGNHERLMLDAREDPLGLDFWLCVVGAKTLASYGVCGHDEIECGGWVDRIPEAH